MKKFSILIISLIMASGFAFSQNIIIQMDEEVSSLAQSIHEKLIEKNAGKIVIGQFTYNEGIIPLSTYWINQLTGELANIAQRNYLIFSAGNSNDAQWMITGEIVQVSGIIRIYTRLIRLSDRTIDAVYYSNFYRNDISDMFTASSSGAQSSSQSSAASDIYEPDDWDSPVEYVIGANSNAAVLNRAITPDDEDFFLLIPDRDGRLTIETTGSIDTYMYLYDYETEEELADNDDGGTGANARISYNVEAGVAYIAIVQGYSSSTSGSYGFRAYLTVREDSSGWNNPITHEVSENEESADAVNYTITRGFENYYLIVPAVSGRVTIETTGRTDTYMELYDADTRELLDQNDDGGTNYNARIRFSAAAGGRYIVMVKGYSSNTTGAYGFRAFYAGNNLAAADQYEPDDDPAFAKTLQIGVTQERTFHSGNDVDWIQFQITSAGRYVINARGVNSNRLDTYIELYNSSLNVIAEDDDGGDSLSSRLSVNLNTGIYYLKVWCLDEEPNQGYTVNISAQ